MKCCSGAQKSPSWCQYSANRTDGMILPSGRMLPDARDAGQAGFLVRESQRRGEYDDLAPSGREVLQFTWSQGLAANADHTVKGKDLKQECNVLIRQIRNSSVELDANTQPPAHMQ